MAFFGRVGNLLRQAVNKQVSSQLRSSPSVFQAIRCMSSAPSSKLFVGGISYNTDERSLQEAFSKYGTVVDARVIMDRETGRSRGFGFVTFTSVEEASSAIQALDQKDLHGRIVRVNYANERTRGFSSGGYGPYGSGSGYGGGYGNASYGGSGSGGGYGDSGVYGNNAAGGYGGGGYGPGSYGSGGNFGSGGSGSNYASDSFESGSPGGNHSGSGVNYGNDSDFASGSTGGYGGNTGNFGVAGGSDNYGSASGFGGAAGEGSVAGFGSSDNFGSSGGVGGGDSYFNAGSGGGSGGLASSGFDGSEGLGYGSSSQLDSKESGNLGEDIGDYGEPLKGNHLDDGDDASDFAKRA